MINSPFTISLGMEASFVGDKQVNPHKIPESNTRKIPDQELDKREDRRLRAGATDPGTNKLAGAASRDPKGRCVATPVVPFPLTDI